KCLKKIHFFTLYRTIKNPFLLNSSDHHFYAMVNKMVYCGDFKKSRLIGNKEKKTYTFYKNYSLATSLKSISIFSLITISPNIFLGGSKLKSFMSNFNFPTKRLVGSERIATGTIYSLLAPAIIILT